MGIILFDSSDKCFFCPAQLLHSGIHLFKPRLSTNMHTHTMSVEWPSLCQWGRRSPSIHPSIQSSGLSFDLWSPGSGPAVWTTAPSLPFLGVPSCPIVYPPGTVKTSSSTSSATDQEPQLHSCSLPFKNRLGYQPGQLRDLHASWGLRNFSALPRSFISVWILWVIVCVCVCVYVYIFACVCEDRPVLQAKREDLLVQMREWTELEMSFSAGGFLSASDGYCSTEQQLQYYGESSVTPPSLLLSPPLFFPPAMASPLNFSSSSSTSVFFFFFSKISYVMNESFE